MREEATCPICLDLMTEPVIIKCGHIYCRSCILKNIENQKKKSPFLGNFLCPVCRAQFQSESIQPSKQLGNLIDTIKKMEQEYLCEEHGEKLSLFCEDDVQLICWCCERTQQHKGHTTALAADACQGYREKFRETLTHLMKLEEHNRECQKNIREQITKFQSEIMNKKNYIKYNFKVIHTILRMEMQYYLWRLEDEKQQVLKRLQDSEAQLQKQSQELNKHILELERRCQGSAQELLQDVRDTLHRISAMKFSAPADVSLDIHTVPDFDSMYCQLTKIFKTNNVQVTLHPDTAHNDLLVNEDGKKVTGGSPQVKQDTPARFKDLPCVLGCEAFTSGKHYFAIYLGKGSLWDAGVCLENVPRDNDMRRNPESGFWAISHYEYDDVVALMSPVTPVFRGELSSPTTDEGLMLLHQSPAALIRNFRNREHPWKSGKTMAWGTALTMREEATCPICLDLMTEPVIIDCGHIYCHSCIMKNLENQQQKSPSQGNFHCPVCRAQFRRESIRPSKQLESIIDTIKKMEQEHLCEEHGEKLFLFCEDDGQLICWFCEQTPQHKGHTTVLAADACQGYKENFQESMTYLRKLEEQNQDWQWNIKKQISKFQREIMDKKYCIESYFKVFHMILHMEEKSYLWRLENEKEQVLKKLQDSKAQLEKQSQELNKLILELERRCQGSAQELLQDVRDTLDRTSAMKLNAPEDVSLDIQAMPDIDSILSQFIKLFETDNVVVTLDPDTAHKELLVNEKKKQVTRGFPQVKHETPARFKDLPCVLGCETLTSGKHFFRVLFSQGSEWDVGVCLENVPRDSAMRRDPESGFWAIRQCKVNDYVALTSPLTPLSLQNVGFLSVFVDYEAGLVSFYNLDADSHIFTFPKASFSEPIRPYFCIGEGSHLST
ncbi:E3 ubiquitin-protein ligase TRIM38-like [Sorex araneus]|uniref:E3 ubiquitin-protein ligase TRIM38-like n=1 Tax=Sorex araneus TaxID=42254 RepID=UPI002433AD7B|nr:E3 ubiquitin-protein ligase TRIM38-like [Sorex araneus]